MSACTFWHDVNLASLALQPKKHCLEYIKRRSQGICVYFLALLFESTV